MTRRTRVLLILGSWLVGMAVVRLGLDWADTFDYSPASEHRYLLVAVAALAIAIGGSMYAVLAHRRPGRRQRTPTDPE